MAKKNNIFDPSNKDSFVQAFIAMMRDKQQSELVGRFPKQFPKFEQRVTYKFKIKLQHITKPPVWRRVLVPSQFTFLALHCVIQEAFGWWYEHMWQFGDTVYSQVLSIALPDPDAWDPPTHDARNVTVGDYFRDGLERKKLVYTYDFGDDWHHDIVLEEVIDQESQHASCIAGKGACPEEDCGGPWGYAMLKENGEVEDPAEFDLEEANDAVQSIEDKGSVED